MVWPLTIASILHGQGGRSNKYKPMIHVSSAQNTYFKNNFDSYEFYKFLCKEHGQISS